MEIFKVIEEFPNYSISNLGNIKNKQGRLMIIGKRKSNSGYLQVRLFNNNKYYYRYIHKLVAIAFLPNPNNYRTVNHIDGNKLNNTILNLEWASDEMQQRHAFLTGLKSKGVSFTKSQLFTIYNKSYVIVTFLSLLELAKEDDVLLTQEANFDKIFIELKVK